jgi:hypothetical protein
LNLSKASAITAATANIFPKNAYGYPWTNDRLCFDNTQFLQAINLARFGHDNHHMQSQNAADLLKQFSNLNAPQLHAC